VTVLRDIYKGIASLESFFVHTASLIPKEKGCVPVERVRYHRFGTLRYFAPQNCEIGVFKVIHGLLQLVEVYKLHEVPCALMTKGFNIFSFSNDEYLSYPKGYSRPHYGAYVLLLLYIIH